MTTDSSPVPQLPPVRRGPRPRIDAALSRIKAAVAARLPLRVLGRDITFDGVVELLARAGYAARGFLYLSMGAAALLTAAGLRHDAANGFRVLAEVAAWPLGFVWVTAVAAALAGFALWRAAQVLLDHDGQGTRLMALASRAGQAVSGLVYGGLALSVFDLLDAVADERHTAVRQAAKILAWPGGAAILICIGAFALACGVGNIVQAFLTDFGKRLGCPEHALAWCRWTGRIGYAARGVAFLPLGVFLIEAGLDLDAGQARDFGEALQSLQTQPFGTMVMGLTATGLIAFGLFAVIEARYRRIPAR